MIQQTLNIYDESGKIKQRYDFIDVARAILIILMVVGHSGSPITSYIYLFHIAAFVFLSGYLFKDNSQKLKESLLSRVKPLYIQYIKYQFLFLIVYSVFVRLNIYENLGENLSYKFYISKAVSIVTLGGGSGDLLGAFWYIILLIEVSLYYSIIDYFASKYLDNKIIMTSIIFIIFIIGNIILYTGNRLPRHLDTSMIMILIYHIGVLYKKYEDNVLIKFRFFIISILFIVFLNEFGRIDVAYHIFVNPFYFLIASLSGIYFTIYTSKILVKFFDCKLLKYIGKNTLIILALHFLAFKIVNLIIIFVFSYPYEKLSSFPIIDVGSSWWIIYSIIGIAVPILFKWLLLEIVFGHKRLNLIKGEK